MPISNADIWNQSNRNQQQGGGYSQWNPGQGQQQGTFSQWAPQQPYSAVGQQQSSGGAWGQQTQYNQPRNVNRTATGFNPGALNQQPQAQQPIQQAQPQQPQTGTTPDGYATSMTNPNPQPSAPPGFSGMGGIASSLDRLLSYQERNNRIANDVNYRNRVRMGNRDPGALWDKQAFNTRNIDTNTNNLKAEFDKALKFYGGNKQQAYDEIMRQYSERYNPDAGYNARFNDQGEMDYLKNMLGQMWGIG